MESKTEENSLLALNKIVNRLEVLCFSDSQCRSQKTSKLSNFSIHEILKPSFGIPLKYDNDSDSAYTSDTGDAWSSCDETYDHASPRLQSTKQNLLEAKRIQTPKRKYSSGNRKSDKVQEIRKPFKCWTERWRQQFDDDGYSSSDSESALDLRLERKKTPPKTTGPLPTWVYCTRYSDRPSAGTSTLRHSE